jgi:acyl dehydratase
MAGRALLCTLCEDDGSRLKRLDGRFSSPVFPGETLVTEIWSVGAGVASFQSRSAERDVVVISNGYAEYE